MLRRYVKYIQPARYEIAAIFLIALALTLRILLIAQGWPVSNSDEGTMGLEALHVAYKGEHPVFLYGQTYMGVLEAYIAAAFFHLLGPSLFSLRIGMLLLFTLFLIAMYLLAQALYNKRIALITLLLLCFGSGEIFTRQLKVLGGDAETVLFAALMFLLAFHLATTPNSGKNKQRSLLYAFLGLVIGLGIWSHMLILPFVLMTVLLLLIFCRHEIRTSFSLYFVLGLIIGLLPLLIFNIQHPQQNSIATLFSIHTSGGTGVTTDYSRWDALPGTIMISIPQATGASPLCNISTTPGQWKQSFPCLFFQGIWGLAFLALLALATFVAAREVHRYLTPNNPSHTFQDRQLLVRNTTRLLLLASAILTLIAYLLSPAPALVPATSARYLVGLLVTTPALIFPLWVGIQKIHPVSLSRISGVIPGLLRWSLLLFITVTLIRGTIEVFEEIPAIQQDNQRQQALIDTLLRVHAPHIYSDYWTCNRLIFESNERVICSVLNDNLETGQNRYPAYQTLVKGDPGAAYVFHTASAQDKAFAHQATSLNKLYTHFTGQGYTIYLPAG